MRLLHKQYDTSLDHFPDILTNFKLKMIFKKSRNRLNLIFVFKKNYKKRHISGICLYS